MKRQKSYAQLEKEYKKYNCDVCLKLQQQMDRYASSQQQQNRRDSPSPILLYYSKKGTDQSNRTIEDVWSFTNTKLEKVHDYIQWLFPTTVMSEHNEYAPVLTREDIRKFKNCISYRKNMLKSLDLMLNFYGLVRLPLNGKVLIQTSTNFKTRSKVWLTEDNHNFLRLSRIIRSLSELGMKANAEALYHCLKDKIYPDYKKVIKSSSLRYWKKSLV